MLALYLPMSSIHRHGRNDAAAAAAAAAELLALQFIDTQATPKHEPCNSWTQALQQPLQ